MDLCLLLLRSPRTSPSDHHYPSTSASAPMSISRPITNSPSLTLSASLREDESARMKPELRAAARASARSISGDDGDQNDNYYDRCCCCSFCAEHILPTFPNAHICSAHFRRHHCHIAITPNNYLLRTPHHHTHTIPRPFHISTFDTCIRLVLVIAAMEASVSCFMAITSMTMTANFSS